MSERIGFFICHCGVNIAYRVRVKEVAEYAETFPGVVVAKDYLFMCRIRDRISSRRKSSIKTSPV